MEGNAELDALRATVRRQEVECDVARTRESRLLSALAEVKRQTSRCCIILNHTDITIWVQERRLRENLEAEVSWQRGGTTLKLTPRIASQVQQWRLKFCELEAAYENVQRQVGCEALPALL